MYTWQRQGYLPKDGQKKDKIIKMKNRKEGRKPWIVYKEGKKDERMDGSRNKEINQRME